METSKIIESPIRGEWAIFNPPGHPKLAYDFLAVDKNKSPYLNGSFARHLFSFISVESTYTWSKDIYSPVDGTVEESHDGELDRLKISFIYDLFRLLINKPKEAGGFGPFGGNHVMIKADGYYLLLCHLKKDSILVKKGEVIQAGQKIGEAGNSGSSIQPHLHIQAMNNNQYFPLFKNLLPFKIRTGKVKKDGGWEDRKNIELTNGGHYEFGG
jgi:hypothetical protein